MEQRLNTSDFISLWEKGYGDHPLDRAVGLITALDDIDRNDVVALSVDERDRALFQICANLFGPEIRLFADCTECGAESQVDFSTGDVMALGSEDRTFQISDGRRKINCRLPDSRDLAHALSSATPRKTLLASLLDREDPDDDLLGVVETALAKHSGLADFSLVHDCPECGTNTDTSFDILDYVWRRIAAEAQRLVREVHLLASAYGWSSEEILSLSSPRRALHIAMVEA